MDETRSKKPCARHTAVPDDLSPEGKSRKSKS